MDFVKIQYERTFPAIPEIRTPGDWKAMPRYGLDFYRPQLEVVEGLVKAAGDEALVLVTLYSPFMCAGHTVGRRVLVKHIEEDGEAVRKGLETSPRACWGSSGSAAGWGSTASTPRRRAGKPHVPRPEPLREVRHPYDLRLMKEIDATCRFNILHVCDYEAPYADLAPFLAYPGHVVSCSPRLTTGEVSLRELARRFGRPIMGGLDRKGVSRPGRRRDPPRRH